jgi:hypothetical protein
MEMSLFTTLLEALHGTKSNEQNTWHTNSTSFFNTSNYFVIFASLPFFTLNTAARKYNYVYIACHFTVRSNIQKTIGFQIIQVSLPASFTKPVKALDTHQNASTNRCSFGVSKGLETSSARLHPLKRNSTTPYRFPLTQRWIWRRHIILTQLSTKTGYS